MATGTRCRTAKDRSRMQSRSLLRTNNIGRRSSWNRTSVASTSKHKEQHGQDDSQSSMSISDYVEEKARRNLQRRSYVRTRDSLPRVEYPLVDSASRGYKFVLWKRRKNSGQSRTHRKGSSCRQRSGFSLTALLVFVFGVITFPFVKTVDLLIGIVQSVFMLIFHPIRFYRYLRFGNERAFRWYKCQDCFDSD